MKQREKESDKGWAEAALQDQEDEAAQGQPEGRGGQRRAAREEAEDDMKKIKQKAEADVEQRSRVRAEKGSRRRTS